MTRRADRPLPGGARRARRRRRRRGRRRRAQARARSSPRSPRSSRSATTRPRTATTAGRSPDGPASSPASRRSSSRCSPPASGSSCSPTSPTWGRRLAEHLTEVTGVPIACYDGSLARGARDRIVTEFQDGRRARRAGAVAEGRRHRAQPHRRQPRRALRPLVEPGRRGPGPRPGVAHRPAAHRHLAPPRVPRHGRRAGRGGRRRQAPHRQPRAPQVELDRRPRHRPAPPRARAAARRAAREDDA